MVKGNDPEEDNDDRAIERLVNGALSGGAQSEDEKSRRIHLKVKDDLFDEDKLNKLSEVIERLSMMGSIDKDIMATIKGLVTAVKEYVEAPAEESIVFDVDFIEDMADIREISELIPDVQILLAKVDKLSAELGNYLPSLISRIAEQEFAKKPSELSREEKEAVANILISWVCVDPGQKEKTVSDKLIGRVREYIMR